MPSPTFNGHSGTPPSQIIVTATRTAALAENVPATISVTTIEQVADELLNDVRDLVRFGPGVSVQRKPPGATAEARKLIEANTHAL